MEISLPSFIDFISRSGSNKMSCAYTIETQLNDPGYESENHYQLFRQGVKAYHTEGGAKKDLMQLMDGLPSNRKDSYRALVDGYLKFLGKTTYTSFEPPAGIWKHGKIEIPFTSVLGLDIEDRKTIVHLYVKAEKPNRDQVHCMLALMQGCFAPAGYSVAMLDVRNSKVYAFDDNMLPLMPLYMGEAALLEYLLGQNEADPVVADAQEATNQ